MLYSVIIPCYKSSLSIRKVVEMTAAELEKLNRTPYQFVLVDDKSPDDGSTALEIRKLAEEYPFVTAVELAKNSGQHNAVMAGLNIASGDVFIAMDDDMQTHPSQLGRMFDAFDEGHDIVYGYYKDKKHSGFRNFGSWVNHTSVRILLGKPKDLKTSSFWIIKKFVRDYVIQYRGTYTHLQGLFIRTSSDIKCIPVEHFERMTGSSGYTFKKLIGLWSNIMGFSVVPLRLARNIGFVLSCLSILAAIIVILKKILAPTDAVGWYSLMVAICFFSGLIMLFLGLIGEYLSRMYLGSGNNPQFVIRNIYGETNSEETSDSGSRNIPGSSNQNS